MSEGSGGGSSPTPDKKKPVDIIDHMTEHLSSYDGRYLPGLVLGPSTYQGGANGPYQGTGFQPPASSYQPYYPPSPYMHPQHLIYQHQIHPHYYTHRGYGGGGETGGCLIENMVGNWSPDLSGTYSPFGGGVPPPPSSDETFDHVQGNLHQSVLNSSPLHQPVQQKKQRIVAEVKPLRPSYSDVVSKSTAPPLSPANKTAPLPPPIKQPAKELVKEPQQTKHKPAKQTSQPGSKESKKETASDDILDTKKNKKNQSEWNQESAKENVNNKSKQQTTQPANKKNKKQSGRTEEKANTKAAKTPSYKTNTSYYTGISDVYRKYVANSDDDSHSDDNMNNSDNRESNRSQSVHSNSQQRKSTGGAKVERSINTNRSSGKTKRSQRASKRKDNKLGELCRKWQEKSSYYLIMLASWLINLLVDVAAMSAALLLQLGEVLCRTLVKDIQGLMVWFRSWWSKDVPVQPVHTQSTGPAPLQQNIQLPTTGEEAMKRLLSCKGKDPYSILGLTNSCTDEDIRRYYRSQALLVHPDKNSQPGAEEAFKILVHAFDLIAEPEKRAAYDRYVSETNQVEQAWSELSDLLSQLHEKMHYAATTIRCNNCGKRHKRTLTERPMYAARYCAQCNIHHSAKEGDMWCEVGRWLFSRRYLACMEGSVYEITEWAKCQGGGLTDLVPHSHSVHYRVLLGGVDRNNTQTGEAEFEDLLSSIYGQGGNQQRHGRMNNRRKGKKTK